MCPDSSDQQFRNSSGLRFHLTQLSLLFYFFPSAGIHSSALFLQKVKISFLLQFNQSGPKTCPASESFT